MRYFLAALFPVLLAALSALPVHAQEKTELKWKFELNKPIWQELTTETNQDLKVMGMDVKQKQKQTFTFSWTPTEEKDGIWKVRQRIEGVKMMIEIGGNKIEYDSDSAGLGNNPLSDFFKALMGSEFQLTIKDMKVLKVEGRNEFVKKLSDTNQQMKPLLEAILTEESLKQMADPSFASLPNKEVGKDAEWENKVDMNLGPVGKYETSYKYKYVGKDEKDKELDRITVATSLKYIPPPSDAVGAGLPFKIKSADLTSKDATGTLLFDSKNGRVASSEMNLTLSGKLEIEIGGQTTTVDLKQTQKTMVKTSEKK